MLHKCYGKMIRDFLSLQFPIKNREKERGEREGEKMQQRIIMYTLMMEL